MEFTQNIVNESDSDDEAKTKKSEYESASDVESKTTKSDSEVDSEEADSDAKGDKLEYKKNKAKMNRKSAFILLHFASFY